ncbi:MAG: RagB/SusD family nutrient uptake outer membrane protein [Bacteroidia bacterium]|nr:RagB/SusD family nutrient uptake outer membrane protein [Bacteroidia bacterium]
MKTKYILSALLFGSALVACDDFLDEMPDNRAELNTEDKITSLLVSAYPTNSLVALHEFSSDNAMDNGPQYDIAQKVQEEAYLWEDVTDDGNDTPKQFWNTCYMTIATANQALDAISKMGEKGLEAQKAEALLCRAYAHFILSNTFCMAYNPQTADKELGIPYSFAPETEVSPVYTRGTLAEVYDAIEADIVAALPYIKDDLHKAPKYHFTKKSAYAFAARFYQYKQDWAKCEEYATVALGADPASVMRDWATMAKSGNYSDRCNMYRNPSEPANLLMTTAGSSWGYWAGAYNLARRYACNYQKLFGPEIARPGTVGVRMLWGTSHANLYCAASCWGSQQKIGVSKIYADFEYTDKVNGIGYRRIVLVPFSTNETLLTRAEARLLQNNTEGYLADINIWLQANTKLKQDVTLDDINNIYGAIDYKTSSDHHVINNEVHPQGFTYSKENEYLVQCLLHLRRIETIHEGFRWLDVKRWGIVLYHNVDGGDELVLGVDDPRRAVQLPQDVIAAGLEPNPRN